MQVLFYYLGSIFTQLHYHNMYPMIGSKMTTAANVSIEVAFFEYLGILEEFLGKV